MDFNDSMTSGAAVTDGDALIRSILSNPADDAPRLVYADWLEEHGRGEDAEFIRVQVELAHLGFDGGFHTDERGRLRHSPPHVATLTERQMELWFDNHGRPDLPAAMANWPVSPANPPGIRLRVRRGFIERLACPGDEFLAVAAELFARQPITHVRLSDRQSINQGGGFAWFCTGVWKELVDDVPAELWPHLARDDQPMVTYATSDEADAALGRACLRYGRLLVGLPDRPEGD